MWIQDVGDRECRTSLVLSWCCRDLLAGYGVVQDSDDELTTKRLARPPMRIPQLSVRSLMVLVAVIGLLLGSGVFAIRCYRAREYALQRVQIYDNDIVILQGGISITVLASDRQEVEQMINDSETKKREYEHLARHPWHGLPVDDE
jgi:hypothetical protein